LKRSHTGDPSAKLPVSAGLPKRAKLHGSGYNSSANLFQLESGDKGEVELNLKGDVHTHTPSKQFKVFQNMNHSNADSRKL